MATKVEINGFGRIGRLVARAIIERDDHDFEQRAGDEPSDAPEPVDRNLHRHLRNSC